ncbi:deoxyribose-phosphate aldolase [Corynebacterium minutissimum]|uniref:Deoxyribose-phosphate aldolase n=1 Tax=Corynebacterium minutissimum TaxID=38301 RepID=A0A2X4RNK1_9CORY|nr:deoxyribose-phosphate aldolase [Corynebacterium minutissimum]KHO28871.1 deoxyribose-phosphate aldolase [Corynebacterium minutissimum]MCG7228818.1 deoxyribose-phosphate aldolase [Corynebacterium minutissimum]MCG7237935.1 deoxyribose-phosphate aldolase [Corynebacterium minutissimum]QPS59510.1 deoxyribose-phosphate aldolase [Corynebacterium minutissimum]SQH98942.1 deoxyribose-phosphate aldolase [Corynebacterium minutissimum]
MISRTDVAQMIDHTLLKPEATPDQVAALAKEAGELGTYSICVSPNQLPVEVPAGVHVATVVGFPSGAVKSEVKAAETARAVKDGAEEIDMVVNLSQVKSHDYAAVEADIKAVRDAAPAPVIVKVIIESAALDDEEIVATCQAAERAGADFVKTSTGFHPAGGASVHAVKLMADTVEGRLGVKASGGIRDAEAAQAMIDAGATRLGLSSSAAVLEGFEA